MTLSVLQLLLRYIVGSISQLCDRIRPRVFLAANYRSSRSRYEYHHLLVISNIRYHDYG